MELWVLLPLLVGIMLQNIVNAYHIEKIKALLKLEQRRQQGGSDGK